MTETVGVLIKRWRLRLKPTPTQGELGVTVGVGRSMVSAWETGSVPVMAKHWPALAAALNLSEAEVEQLRTALLDQYIEAA